MTTPTYGDLIRINTSNCTAPQVLRRVPLGSSASSGGVDEATLRDLLFAFPQTLPVSDIDAAYANLVPVCKELQLPAGSADALFVNQFGRLTLVEFKLWSNPQARREVIGQILDYAKDMSSWSYEDLQRQIARALEDDGENVLYELVDQQSSGLNEADFVDNVTRHLRRGEFLLLIVGDGIRESAAEIIEFVQRYSGLHFKLAMVETALYRDDGNRLIVQPRVFARTEIVQRLVVEVEGDIVQDVRVADVYERQTPQSQYDEETLRFWSAVVRDYSFTDYTVPVPDPKADYMLAVPVRKDGSGSWGLNFFGHLRRNPDEFDCYLVPDRDNERAKCVFERLVASICELRLDMGDELEHWIGANKRDRLGFRTQKYSAFLSTDETDHNYCESVQWMKEHLNILVSTLHPRILELLEND